MPSPLNYDGGLTCALQVTDLASAVQWYQDMLGFELLYKVDEIAWAELATEVKGVNIGLSQVESVKVNGGNTVPTFGVHDIAVARKQLEAKQVRFDGETREYPGMVKLATFYDPDGNAFMLYEDLQKRH